MARKLTFEVVEGAQWGYGDGKGKGAVYAAGEKHEVSADAGLAKAIAAAADAGVLKVHEGDLPKSAVESEKDSLKAQERAQAARHKVAAYHESEGLERDPEAEEAAAQKEAER